MHRETGGERFAEALVPERLGRNAQLERIAALVDWAPLAEIVSVIYAAPRGRPAYPPLLMVKAMLLAQWYELSDEQLEQALWDRVSFRRFVGLAPRLFAALNRQLEARRLALKQGALLDATLVAAQARRPGGRAGSGSERDPDAGWTRKGGRAHFG